MATLRFGDPDLWHRIESHVAGRSAGDRFAFAFTRVLPEGSEGPALLVEDVELIHDYEVAPHRTGWTIAPGALDRILRRAVVEDRGLVQFHDHQLDPPPFPGAGAADLPSAVEHLADLLGERPFATVVWDEGTVRAEWFRRRTNGLQRGTFRSVTVVGEHLRLLNARPGDEDRFTRQVPVLGRAAQATLRRLRVAVVGQGGTGSHVVTQLAYLGVRDLVLLDDDVVDTTSLNRMVTAEPADIGATKTMVARRRVRALDPGASVRVLPGLIAHREPVDLPEVDLVIGCVDDDGPRHQLNALAVDTGLPYLDIGTGVDAGVDPPVLGARVSFVLPGGPCLTCTAELDPTEVGRWHHPHRPRSRRSHGYGTAAAPGPGPGESVPSVVHLNALAVSTAMAEVVAWITGSRPPALRLDVDLNGDPALPGTRVSPSADRTRRAGCADCA